MRDALVGINQLIDEDADKGKEAPPVNAEPITRQFLRTFGNAPELKRDQLQKFLKGSITTPDEFVQRGWCSEKNKVFTRTNPLDFARERRAASPQADLRSGSGAGADRRVCS